jgi:hypothetical protein
MKIGTEFCNLHQSIFYLKLKNVEQSQLPLGGRLCHLSQNWEKITPDQKILEATCINGYKVHFTGIPCQISVSKICLSEKDTKVLDLEIQEMLEKSAADIAISDPNDKFMSTLFVRQKKKMGT